MKVSILAGVAALAVLPFATHAQTVQAWMHPDVKSAWGQGYEGQGTTITVIDDYASSSKLTGTLGTGYKTQHHGDFTLQQAGMVAPLANVRSIDFGKTARIGLYAGLNVINASYGMYSPGGYSRSQVDWSGREQTVITYAKNGSAVVVKAAGNDGIVLTGANADGNVDYLNRALAGMKSAIFVGALTRNGTTSSKAPLASYSNTPGSDPTLQNSFVTVGVDSAKLQLQGTSFAAPIVSGYAAILGSKFTSATPTQIANQLLTTARTDTIAGYNPALHGRGEASLSRALAPVAIR